MCPLRPLGFDTLASASMAWRRAHPLTSLILPLLLKLRLLHFQSMLRVHVTDFLLQPPLHGLTLLVLRSSHLLLESEDANEGTGGDTGLPTDAIRTTNRRSADATDGRWAVTASGGGCVGCQTAKPRTARAPCKARKFRCLTVMAPLDGWPGKKFVGQADNRLAEGTISGEGYIHYLSSKRQLLQYEKFLHETP